MIQGTGSHVGKTILVAGLCRVFARRGLKVAPFKAQNMALNSFVTRQGEEIGRATAVQAFAARQEPLVHMNPVLLKPKSDITSQLILHGHAVEDVTAKDYFVAAKLQARRTEAVRQSIAFLKERFDLIIAEGAGSCAEPNLRQPDIANMGAAHLLGAKVYIAADIDMGGVFAQLLGSMQILELVSPSDLPLVRGFLINKFRGDLEILKPAIDFLEQHTGRRVLGVLPYLHDLALEEEDRIRPRPGPRNDPRDGPADARDIRIGVVYLPHISNANDFDFLAAEPGVDVHFLKSARDLEGLDALILPGTKNTTGDLALMRQYGLAQAIEKLAGRTPILGVCGGYQMLGRMLNDPQCLESEHGSMPGLGLLDFAVTFGPRKVLVQRTYEPAPGNPFAEAGRVTGYEIHAGVVGPHGLAPLYTHEGGTDGARHPNLPIWGAFIHDLFRNPRFTRAFVNELRRRQNLAPLQGPLADPQARANQAMDRLADVLEAHAGDLIRDVAGA